MKKSLLLLLTFMFSAAIFWSCGKSVKIVEIQGYDTYDDPVSMYSIKYPKNWLVVQKIPGQTISVYTNKLGIDRFRTWAPEGDAAGRIILTVHHLNESLTIDSIIKTFKIFQPQVYSNPEKVTVDGAEGTKLGYAFELNDGNFHGETYFVAKDPSILTVITFESFSGTFKEYEKNFKEIIKSVKLAVPPKKKDTVTILEEAPPPSANLVQKVGQGYTIMIPDNFNMNRGKAKDAVFSANYMGDRRADCNIQIDVKDATKQKNLKKIVDDSKGNFPNASNPLEVSIGGQKAYYMAYSPVKNIKSRVYFVIKADKLFQITMNWYLPEEKDYLPVFEKCINSIKLN